MDEDERPALANGEGVAPEPQRVTEDDGSRRDRVERLAGHVRPDPRDAYDEGVEGRVDRRPAQLDRAHERLGVRDRGRAGEDGSGDQRAMLLSENLPAKAGRQGRVDPAER